MIEIIFTEAIFSNLKKALLNDNLESSAVLIANPIPAIDKTRLVVTEVCMAMDPDYVVRGPISAQLKPSFFAPLAKQAKNNSQSLIFVHTHPHSEKKLYFSVIDDEGEKRLAKFLASRKIVQPHAAIVMSAKLVKARKLGTDENIKVIALGAHRSILHDPNLCEDHDFIYDRQVRAFGAEGQHILKTLTVGIVGLGGTGSIVAEQLTHLGVRNFLLIDPDVIEKTNLNRVVGAKASDVGAKKISVATRHILSINPSVTVKETFGSVLDAKTAQLLADTDLFFCCTDSHGSRAVLNQLAYQYFVPCIDLGVSIAAEKNHVSRVIGRVQMLSPGLGCLACSNLLNADLVRYDLMSSYERQQDPYFIGSALPEPAVISINSTVSSLAVTMFLSAVVGIPSDARYQIYNGIEGIVRSIDLPQNPNCIVCSKRGALGRGTEWPLPARQI